MEVGLKRDLKREYQWFGLSADDSGYYNSLCAVTSYYLQSYKCIFYRQNTKKTPKHFFQCLTLLFFEICVMG